MGYWKYSTMQRKSLEIISIPYRSAYLAVLEKLTASIIGFVLDPTTQFYITTKGKRAQSTNMTGETALSIPKYLQCNF